jgi:pimeloyl-ACP methyl ester carboxylesterase
MLGLWGPACAWRQSDTDLALIYNAAAQHHGPDRNPIIAIPGILGSRLLDTRSGVSAWGAFEPGAANPEDPDGARMIALPIRDEDLSELSDDVEPAGVLEKVHIELFGIPVDIQAYAGILSTLGAGGYRDRALGLAGEIDYGDRHYTCFQFAYDWRRDNVESARKLRDFILEKREYVRAEHRERFGIDEPNVRFDIAAHSMGGLVTRYFLMYGGQDLPADGSLPRLTWEGAELVERVILIGTPNAGSAMAFRELVEGTQLAPVLPSYSPALMGTFPSVYQLLPRPRHRPVVWDGDSKQPVDILDPEVWERMGWGLAAPSEAGMLEVLMPDVADAAQRRAVALQVQRRMLSRAKAFMRAVDRPAQLPPMCGSTWWRATPSRLSSRFRWAPPTVASTLATPVRAMARRCAAAFCSTSVSETRGPPSSSPPSTFTRRCCCPTIIWA